MAQEKEEKIWCIAYINKDHLSTIEADLEEHGYQGRVKAVVPTVKILRKQFKREKFFDEVPLLFNYGFFEMPYKQACYESFLGQLRNDIPAIFAWVSDPSRVLSMKPELNIDNRLINFPRAAIATEREMAEIIKQSQVNSVYMDRHINSIEPGKHIILKGYPFDNLPAEVVHINKKKKEIRIRLEFNSVMKEATVSFDNVFYTVYEAHDAEKFPHESLDEINDRSNYLIDKLYVNLPDNENT